MIGRLAQPVAKLARAIITIFLMVTAVFVLLRNAGDPVTVFLGPDATPEMRTAYTHQFGLDRPLLEQFLAYFDNVLRGSFGRSYVDHREALLVVIDHLGLTLILMGTALALAIIFGLFAGVLSAVFRSTLIDRFLTVASSVGLCVPAFFLALILMLVFAIQLKLLPTSGADSWRNLILPATTVAAASSAVLARYTRTAMIDALESPYVLAARSRDIPAWRILIHHALPNAAVPILTVLGLLVGGVVTGSMVVETVFSWPGMGNLFITSIGSRDIPVVQAIVILSGTAMILSNLAVDVLCILIDPRARRV
ncbi:ABC-type dipeptide/oligopeptide/nickel transport system permease component [Bradyrhizobium sp. USDA 326]|uniref:ABC transporter permease n=1 Tax=Bradyrhizobium sp. USDA 326 TaxID=3377726 RepID=UPI003C769A5B